MTPDAVRHRYTGHCPVCRRPAVFESTSDWLRDNLECGNCGSIPRERAFAHCLETMIPGWRHMRVHECSPADRSISARMRAECLHYVGTQYFPGTPAGTIRDGWRCENLEALSFADGAIDLHCHLDVLEHVNDPAACFAEMSRTLRPGGHVLFTVPVYADKAATERRAFYDADGSVRHFAEPEYHGNPIDPQGALVTFHYGRDLADLIRAWAPRCGVTVITINDAAQGILGEFREVFLLTRRV